MIGQVLLALVPSIAQSIISLAIWRLIFGFMPIEEPTKWSIWITTGLVIVGLVGELLTGARSLPIFLAAGVAAFIAPAICWWLWVVKPMRNGTYYG